MPSFYNQAVLSTRDGEAFSNVVTGNINETLTAVKTPLVPTYTAGGRAEFILSLVNTGDADYTNVTVTDNLGEYELTPAETAVPLTYTEGSVKVVVNGVYVPLSPASFTPPFTITGLTVPAGGSTVIVYETTVNSYAPLAAGSSITNIATISAPALEEDITAEAVINVSANPVLSVEKELSPTEITGGGELTYTFTFRNTGNTPALADYAASLTDVFDPELDITSVLYNGVIPWTQGNQYTYTGNTFETAEGQITVPAATYTTDPETGLTAVIPGTATLSVTGNVSE